jgi:hypothetical protein
LEGACACRHSEPRTRLQRSDEICRGLGGRNYRRLLCLCEILRVLQPLEPAHAIYTRSGTRTADPHQKSLPVTSLSTSVSSSSLAPSLAHLSRTSKMIGICDSVYFQPLGLLVLFSLFMLLFYAAIANVSVDTLAQVPSRLNALNQIWTNLPAMPKDVANDAS